MANVEEKKNIATIIQQSSHAGLAAIPEVAERFKNIYAIMNGGDTKKAEVKYEAERFHFMKIITDNPKLKECTKLSLYGTFLDMGVNGLSFDPALKHAYIVPFDINIGTKQSPKWEKRASLMISGYGELHMRIQQKQIKYADNPILVYEGDEFVHGTENGHVILKHKAAFPRKTDNIIACYIRIERNDGSVDYKVLSISEVEKLRKYSKSPDSKAWTDGLPGMIQAKVLKHAFRSYPKMRLGEFSQLQSNTIDTETEVVRIDYGISAADASALPNKSTVEEVIEVVDETATEQPNGTNNPIADVSFAEPENEKKYTGKRFIDDDF